MSKYGPSVYASEHINTKNHWAVGIQWPVVGSKGDIYTVEMQDKGISCDCPAYKKCKHIKLIEKTWLEIG